MDYSNQFGQCNQNQAIYLLFKFKSAISKIYGIMLFKGYCLSRSTKDIGTAKKYCNNRYQLKVNVLLVNEIQGN